MDINKLANDRMSAISRELMQRTMLGQCSANNEEYAKLYRCFLKWEKIERNNRGVCHGMSIGNMFN